MQFDYQLSSKAEDDIFECYASYEKQKSGLGDIFLPTLDTAKNLIRSNPNSYTLVFKEKVKAYHLTGFPISFIYWMIVQLMYLLYFIAQEIFHRCEKTHRTTWTSNANPE